MSQRLKRGRYEKGGREGAAEGPRKGPPENPQKPDEERAALNTPRPTEHKAISWFWA